MAQSSSKAVPQHSGASKERIKVMLYIVKYKECKKLHKQICVTYNQTPPQAFLRKLRDFVVESNSEQYMEKFHVSLEWQQEATTQQPSAKRKRKLLAWV